jgi:hypothetical protein
LSDQKTNVIVCRQSDTLWHHLRRVGVYFLFSVPTKARDDTLTALAVVFAVAAQEKNMEHMVSRHCTEQAANALQH